MKVYILIFLIIAVQLASSTITLDKIGEKVHAGLKILKDKAITKLHKLKAEIELKKLHQLHVSHFVPYAHKHYVHEHYSKKTPLIVDAHQIHRLQHYFEPHHHKHHHHVPPLPPVHHIHEYHHKGYH